MEESIVEGRTLSYVEAAAYLGLQPATLRVWVSHRRVPHVKVGSKVRFIRGHLDEYLAQNTVKAVG